jgi:ribosomal protein L20A (L18A)
MEKFYGEVIDTDKEAAETVHSMMTSLRRIKREYIAALEAEEE